jgi:hypothetical protein
MDQELTKAQRERLDLLMISAADVVQAVDRVLKHGPDSRPPKFPDWPTNKERLEEELGFLGMSVALLVKFEDVSEKACEKFMDEKFKTIGLYTKYQESEE